MPDSQSTFLYLSGLCVSAQTTKRHEGPIPSRCVNGLTAKLSGVNIHDFGTTIKACPLLRSLPQKRR
jgi:hypothetical protein